MKRYLVLSLLLSSVIVSSLMAEPSLKAIKPDPDEQLRLNMVYAQIKQFYVNDKTDQQLFANAIQGMVAGLDPHSVYFDEEALKDFKAQTQGNFIGVGIELTMEKNMVKIVTPIDGTPAQKAGLKAGEYIIAINNTPLMDMSLTKVIKMLRGKPGSQVTVTVITKTDKKPRQVVLQRTKIHIDSVRSELLQNHFGYIRISQFQPDTSQQVLVAIKKLQRQSGAPLAGLIIDLRNDPGGVVDAAVEVADAFLDSDKLGTNKKIVYTEGRFKQASITYNAKSGDILHGAPLVVLINEGSASAAEIVAGALQDHKRAVLIGQRSFGKGSVQTLLPLDDKTAVKLTTAYYYTPNGRSIQAEGIEPDIAVDDLQIKPANEEALLFMQVRENNLNGHLQKVKATLTPAPQNNIKQNKLALKDYQLHEALNVLRTLELVGKLNPASTQNT